MNICLQYDDSFDGFLSAVFYAYENKQLDCIIVKSSKYQLSLLNTPRIITTDLQHVDRIINGLQAKGNKSIVRYLYTAFLSENNHVEDLLFYAIKQVFKINTYAIKDFSDQRILNLAKLVKMVGREKHRMEAFVRFRLTKDEIYFASVEPDFNVLPLIRKHFLSRYADQKWLIYDIRRQFGLAYDLNDVKVVSMHFDESFDPTKTTIDHFASEELEFQNLWQHYFQSTNIKSRKDTKLHQQHVPPRYWKYLSEKQPIIK